jgi:hypothetical protein
MAAIFLRASDDSPVSCEPARAELSVDRPLAAGWVQALAATDVPDAREAQPLDLLTEALGDPAPEWCRAVHTVGPDGK